MCARVFATLCKQLQEHVNIILRCLDCTWTARPGRLEMSRGYPAPVGLLSSQMQKGRALATLIRLPGKRKSQRVNEFAISQCMLTTQAINLSAMSYECSFFHQSKIRIRHFFAESILTKLARPETIESEACEQERPWQNVANNNTSHANLTNR